MLIQSWGGYNSSKLAILESKFISIDYLKRSASLGWVQAMEELGQQYLIGSRVNQDKNQGKKWLKKAHDKGSQIAETIFCNSLPVAKQNSCRL